MTDIRDGRTPGLPPSRDTAFVVHLTRVKETSSDQASGRVEHVRTGRSVLFNSAEELMRFMRETLAAIDADER